MASPTTDSTWAVSPVRQFASARRAWCALALAVLLGALSAWIGLLELPVPAVAASGSTIPVWQLLGVAVGAAPVLGLHSLARDQEARTDVHRQTEHRYLAGLATACFGAHLALAALTLPAASTGVLARALLGWLGVALVSGRVLGWQAGWVLPAVVMSVLSFWGPAGGHGWWEFNARPLHDVPSLLLAILLLATGLAARALTPWRLSPLTHQARAGSVSRMR